MIRVQHCCHVEIWMRVYFMASRCFLRKSSLFEKWTDDFSGGIFYIYARAYICSMSSELGFGVLGFPVARVYARALWMSTVLGFGKISCDSASWCNFIFPLPKKKLRAASSRTPLASACVLRVLALCIRVRGNSLVLRLFVFLSVNM